MQLISYCAGSTYITGDRIAHAMLHYATALVRTGTADTVSIPVERQDGSPGSATLLLSPVTQMSAEDVPERLSSTEPELVDEKLVARLVQLTDRLLTPPTPTFEAHSFNLDDFDI